MPASLVVEHFDVIEQCLLRVRVAFEPLALLAFDRRRPALHHRVVVTIAAAAQGAEQLLDQALEALRTARVGGEVTKGGQYGTLH